MRITKRTDIAVRLLMYCAVNTDRIVTKSEVAENCGVSENHLAQVINQLSQQGYLRTMRGRNGGICLERPAAEIRIGDVFRDVEGGLPIAECFAAGSENCPFADVCRLKEALATAVQAFYAALDEVTLDSFVCGNQGLTRVMQPMACPR